MSENKIYKKLPAVLQTTAIKNFFESTVEQLFSKANSEVINGYIGNKTLENYKSGKTFIAEPTATRQFYSLSPVVNTINITSGQSENLIFFDELINTLKTYGVDVKNQNKLFGEQYYSYLPPINVDKLVNYQEYFWYPECVKAIKIQGSLTAPIDVINDIIGKKAFTPAAGKTLRNGMVIRFEGDFVIPSTYINKDYIVEGVGDAIFLIPKPEAFENIGATTYTESVDLTEAYDASIYSLSDPSVVFSAASISNVIVVNAGIGYVNPTVVFTGANTAAASGTATLHANGAVSSISVDAGGTEYSGLIGVTLTDIAVNADADMSQFDANVSPIITDEIIVDSNTNILVGQVVTGFVNGIVSEINTVYDVDTSSYIHTIVLNAPQTFTYDDANTNPTLSFTGRDFLGEVRLDNMHTITSSNVNILESQAVVGINPNTGEYYLQGGLYSFDKNLDAELGGDGDPTTGDLPWGGKKRELPLDYIVIGRGSKNNNVWSRTNFWFHKDNFTDAGMDLPTNDYRARRPIIEFNYKLDLYNHGASSIGYVSLACTEFKKAQQYDSEGNPVGGGLEGMPSGTTVDDVPVENAIIIFPNEEPSVSKYIYTAKTDVDTTSDTYGLLQVSRIGNPALNPAGAVDGDTNFVPWEVTDGQTVYVTGGTFNIGKEFYWTASGWVKAQEKPTPNTPPLFKLYDDTGIALDDVGIYPNSTFAGSKIFSYKQSTNINTADDEVLGFPLTYRQFKASSEIEFENNIISETHSYIPLGSDTSSTIAGYYFYRTVNQDSTDNFETYWKTNTQKNIQRIVTTYNIDQYDIDSNQQVYYIGGVPAEDTENASGYDVNVKVNGVATTAFAYAPDTVKSGFIKFDTFNFTLGDFIEIDAYCPAGLISLETISKFELPVSWRQDPSSVTEILRISEPEYLPHFKSYMETQVGFEGAATGANNFDNSLKNSALAKDIVFSDQDLVVGAFLLDDQPHNLIDAIRFNSEEYEKYYNRLKKEIDSYYSLYDITNFSNEYVLERVLRNLLSYRVGKEIFNRTYIIPFGDNYTEEQFVINDVTRTEFVSSLFANLDKIENSLLVYKTDSTGTNLLTVDKDYTITSYNPITVETTSNVTYILGDELLFKLYDENRDSAQCPPTPSTMGLYPLTQPSIMMDTTYETPVEVIVGHDGSKTPLWGDRRDAILLEFEKRVYNAAKAEFRAANSLPELNFTAVKKGAFRDTGFDNREWFDLMRYHFSNWVNAHNLDPVVNEFYDNTDTWSWNYRGSLDLPGHWRGWMEYYYDTYEPQRHPWEMLGFFEKPMWWEEEYGTDYSSNNMMLWQDLEEGIIRQGPRENVTDSKYLINNPFRRPGLHMVVPVDSNGDLKAPYDIITTGSTAIEEIWTNSKNLTNLAALTSSYKANSFLNVDGVNVSYDASNIYVQSRALVNHPITNKPNAVGHSEIMEQDLSFVFPRTASGSASTLYDKAVAVLVNGLPLHNPKDYTTSWNNEDEWHYNKGIVERHSELTYGHAGDDGVLHYYFVEPVVLNLDEWDSTEHSPIVGWAFDGLPIYGPYGYRNPMDPDSGITNIKSPFRLRQGYRTTGPGGAHTGVFVEDYELDAAVLGQYGYTDLYNTRYGYTPDSPSTPIRYYVATLDDSGNPMFPYAVGGGVMSHTGSSVTWGQKFFTTALDANNSTYTGYINSNATPALISEFDMIQSTTGDKSAQWKFGDLSPVEYAWRSSVGYPFAVVEALLLAKPGAFATSFADPTKNLRPTVNSELFLNNYNRKRWDFTDANAFSIHGTFDANNTFVTNIGYTQFIHSWIKFQGLDQELDFADKLRSLNIKLGHRLAGYVDASTMVVRTDQYSSSGTAKSLIVPNENITVQVHSSPYKSRNFYSGVIVEKTTNGYKVSGFDKNIGYFNTLESDTAKGREKVQVGGKPASYINWEPNVPYKKETIVTWQSSYYRAPKFIPATTTFNASNWQRLAVLPQVGGATGVLYQETTGTILRVDYDTEFTSVQDVYDFLIGLGKYQSSLGYYFNEVDTSIGEVRNWAYAAKQFLFWTTGGWEVGNTLELSPLASKVIFEVPQGFIAKINRSERTQFTILDEDGIAITPTDCEILREDNRIEIIPPSGKQIYAVMLFVKEIEHALTIDNTTIFNDVIFSPTFNQKHNRFKLKARRTVGWDGRLLSNGFIINGSELLPNLDNLAEGLGRYHELGFLPVEKTVYQVARNLFGFEERSFLTDIDISDDEQFDFYRGMLQSKGTSTSLTRIARSNVVVQGNVTVYDEWALRVSDFGDTENNQSLELKLEKADIVNDPQLITLSFPEDITGVVEKIDVIARRYKYYTAPEVVISAPTDANYAEQATAAVTLNSLNEIESVTVTNKGSGYAIPVGVTIIAGNVVTDAVDTEFQTVTAVSTGDWIATDGANLSGNITLTDHFGNSSVIVDLTTVTEADDIATLINNEPDLGGNITAAIFRSDANIAGTVTAKYTLTLTGSDFTIVNADANLYLDLGRYQPTQRYAIETANATTASNVTVTVDDVIVSQYVNGANASAGYNWTFDAGDRWTITTISEYAATATPTFVLGTGTEHSSPSVSADNNIIVDSDYPYIDLYINDILVPNMALLENSAVAGSTIYTNVWELNGAGTELTIYIERLPKAVKKYNNLSSSFVLGNNSVIKLVERATVQFTTNYQGDLPGSILNIVSSVQDGIAIKLGSKRVYEITPDLKNDDTILIDIDDATRFLKKPIGVRDFNLWPTTNFGDYLGASPLQFIRMPNSGYVNSANVNFMSYGLADLPDLFAPEVIVKPSGGHLIHVAESENKDWNVYNLTTIASGTSFLLQSDGQTRAKLYTDKSLFNFLDTNMIGEADTGRYLDYFLTLKNANVSDNVVIWTNEKIIQQSQAELINVKAPRMIEARIKSIGPAPGSNISMIDYRPVTTRTFQGVNVTNTVDANTLQLSGFFNSAIKENDAVSIYATSGVMYSSSATALLNSAGNITLTSINSIPVEFTAPNSLTIYAQDAAVNGKQVYVESVNVAAQTFVIKDAYFANSNVLSGMGSVGYTLSVLPDYMGGNAEMFYYAANAATNSFTIEGVELANIVSGVNYTGDASSVTFNGNGNITLKTTDYIPPTYNGPATLTFFSDEPTANNIVVNVARVTRNYASYDSNGTGLGIPANVDIIINDTVFSNANVVYTANASSVTYNSYGNVTLSSAGAIPADFTVPGYIRIRTSAIGSKSANNRPVYVTDANLVTNTFTIYDGFFTSPAFTANLGIDSYSLELYSNTIDNLGNVSFELTVPSQVEVRHMNRTKIITDGNHNLEAGQTVRVFADMFNGTYYVRSTPTPSSFIIDAPYTHSDTRTGSVLKKGLMIKTTDPHGITAQYAENNKRVAVHFADPKSYNDIYYIDTLTPDSITVKDRFPIENGTAYYLERVQGYASQNANTVTISNNGLLTETTVFFSANMQIVPANAFSVSGGNITFDAGILNSNADVLTGFTIFREPTVDDNRYPVLTTIDHTKVMLNGSEIQIDSYNNLQGVADNINREMNLRRGMMNNDGSVLSVGFNLLKDYNTLLPIPTNIDAVTPARTNASGQVLANSIAINSATSNVLGKIQTGLAPAYQMGNYGPYVRDENTLIALAGAENITGKLQLSTGKEKEVDPSFNEGPILIGPLKGVVYTDPNSNNTYMWNFELHKYIKVQPPLNYFSDPDEPYDVGVADLIALNKPINFADPTYSDGTDFASTYIDSLAAEIDGETAIEDPVAPPNPVYDDPTYPVLTRLASQNVPMDLYISATEMGRARAMYYFSDTRGGNVATSPNYGIGSGDTSFRSTVGPRWRLKAASTPSGWIYEVYEIVKNDQNKFYWILVDKVDPPLSLHDFWGTINENNDFFGLPIEKMYYDTDTQFTGNTSIQKDSVSANEEYYISIPPVEPAFYVGKQLIREPFAVTGGNGSNATVTWSKLPPATISASAPNLRDTTITVNATGYNSFFMWAPGLTSGEWAPTPEGPGNLEGPNDILTYWGYGTGYYTADDTHTPTSYSANPVQGGPYPGYSSEGWSRRQPRFKYSKDFTVYPAISNDSSNSNIANTTINSNELYFDNPNLASVVRPDDIFVACFWTEPHTYVRQLIGYDFNNFDAAGNPAPVYGDYNGTVTRVKYIRLSELPADVCLRRPIPDTGWAGRGWKNLVTDNVKLPGEFNPSPGDANNPWAPFEITSVPSGSTNEDPDDPSDTGDPIVVTNATPVPSGTGLGRAINTDLDRGLEVPTVDSKPVLTGSALAGLPTACEVVPSPVVSPPNINLPCYSRPSEVYEEVITEIFANAVSRENFVFSASVASPTVFVSQLLDISSLVYSANGNTVSASMYSYDSNLGNITLDASALNSAGTTSFKINGIVREEHIVQIVGKEGLYVFFDFSDPGLVANGITVEQSDDKTFSDTTGRYPVSFVVDTQSTPIAEGGIQYRTDGKQVYAYGFTPIPEYGVSLLDSVNQAFGTFNNQVASGAKKLEFARSSALSRRVDNPTTMPDGNMIGVKNIGFLAKSVDCRRGEYVRITVSKGVGNTKGTYKLYLIYNGVAADATALDTYAFTCPARFAGSRAYRDGARLKSYSYYDIKRKKRKPGIAGTALAAGAGAAIAAGGAGATIAGIAVAAPVVGAVIGAGVALIGGLFGLFGSSKKGKYDGYFGSVNGTDNIYYPYGTGGGVDPNTTKTNVGANANGAEKTKSRGVFTVSQGSTVPEYSTFEFKGYYYAKVSGSYTFTTYSDDASYIWVSPEPDMIKGAGGQLTVNDNEYYKDNGYQPGNPKNYTISNATVNNGGEHPETKKSGTITLDGDNYYYIRGIFGNNKKHGVFRFTVTPPGGAEVDVEFSGRKCPGDAGYVDPKSIPAPQDTPVFNPAAPVSQEEIDRLLAQTGFGYNDYSVWYNWSGYDGQYMTGHKFMPTSFKLKPQKTLVDPQNYGFSVSLDPNRYVSATSQRVTGGFVVPLAKQVTPVSRTPKPLNTQTIVNQPWYNPGTDTVTYKYESLRAVDYSPKRIGSTFKLSSMAAPVPNVVNNGTSSTGNPATGTGSVTLSPVGPTIPSIGVMPSNPISTAAAQVLADTPLAETEFDTKGITYKEVPTLSITPMVTDSNGNPVPAGPPAVARIYRPTPAASVSPEAMAAVPDNTQLIINNGTVTFRNGGAVNDIMAQINCANIGVDASKDPVTGNLVINSCSDSPISIKNGCAPGRLKMVADFHVVRGFEQNRTVTTSESYNDNASTHYAGNSDIEWGIYDNNGDLEDVVSLGNAILGGTTTTATQSTLYSTGGTGYRVGDRLRLIGGTPVNNTQGPLTVICIDEPGYGYNNAANLKVVIGGAGGTPGVGAAAIVTELDELGGIAKIEMLNYGLGYDMTQPPEIKIVDIGASWDGQYVTINTTQMVPAVYNRGTIMLVQTAGVSNGLTTLTENWYRVLATNVTIGANTYTASDVDFVRSNTITITGNVSTVKANTWVTLLTSGDAKSNNHNFYVSNVNSTAGTFTVSDAYFANANIVAGLGTVEYTVVEPFKDVGLTPIPDPRLGKKEPMVHGRIGVNPEVAADAEPTLAAGFKSLEGPLRVAKFLVTGTDDNGTITSLRILDRGLYKVFPSDLTMGIPLEYDYEPIGQNPKSSNALGLVDPLNDNKTYGTNHPEYQGAPFLNSKHPDWAGYTEYRKVIDDAGVESYEEYTGTPGAYDPLTYVYINGAYLSKQQVIGTDPTQLEYGEYITPSIISGGTGARVFLTAAEVPDCSERGRAKEILGLPDSINEVSVPDSLAAALNNALAGAGYKPDDIRFEVEPIGPGVDQLKMVSPGYTRVNFDGTPGFPQKLGIPVGDYFAGALCLQATLSTPDLTTDQATQQLNDLYNSGSFGLLTPEQEATNYGPQGYNTVEPPQVLSLLCIDSINTDPNSWFGKLNGGYGPTGSKVNTGTPQIPGLPTTVTGGTGSPGDIRFTRELYEYEIQNIFGAPVTLNGPVKQNTNVFVFESHRYSTVDQIEIEDGTRVVDLTPYPNLWIDCFENSGRFDYDMPDFLEGGWAYLEYGVPKRWQTPMVNPTYIKNSMLYNQETGKKIVDFDAWDPFKGVIPAFIKNELHFIAKDDPVNYNNARTQFGRTQVGKVWWDTSTLRYMWYEQGDDIERWKSWGRTFPGSTITVCEWVESRALPQNWTGDGTPRWTNRYVTERRWDDADNKYVNYYYYWVQNRSKLDPIVASTLGRKNATEMLARYIANPAGYGLNLISFVSSNSFVLSNIGQILPEDDGVVQINLSRNLNPDGVKHTAWKLMREGDNNSIVPDHLTTKLIDSLAGVDAETNPVPNPRLSEVEKYGIGFRPRQTMFKDLAEARRLMTYTLNEMFADIKVSSLYPGWDDGLIFETAIEAVPILERADWYEVQYIDQSTNQKIRYNSSFKPVYNVASASELEAHLDAPDGTVIQVDNNVNPQLWMYEASNRAYKLIAIKNETVKFADTVFDFDSTLNVGPTAILAPYSSEIRNNLIVFFNNILSSTELWNKFFFTMMKYAYVEQKELDWAFKTSYIYIEKDEEDLIEIIGFKPDNFEKVIEYMNEVKPFTAKIREYKDGKKAPIEVIGPGMISDFDKPPYADPNTNTVRILDDYLLSDANILANDQRYTNYNSITNKSEDPFRHNNTTIVFDRTNWRLTQRDFNANTTTINRSIARNIANLNLQSNTEITSNANVRAADRIFKFDPDVQTMFVEEINAHYGNTTAGVDANVITNADILTNIIDAGNLSLTLSLVKDKVGGNFRGDTLDANVFTKAILGQDSTMNYLDNFSWDTSAWDSFEFDEVIEVFNYQGIFSEAVQGNITFRKNNTTYEGFDGVTFKRVLYGEERPEEMVMLSPLESLILKVTTSSFDYGSPLVANITVPVATPYDSIPYDASGTLFDEYVLTETLGISNIITEDAEITSNANIASNVITVSNYPISSTGITVFYSGNLAIVAPENYTVDTYNVVIHNDILDSNSAIDTSFIVAYDTKVSYQMHQNLFGTTEYLRIIEANKTQLTANVYTYSTEITVADASMFPEPKPQVPGVIWVGSERITYERKTGNTFGALTRGSAGTTVQDWIITDINGNAIDIDVYDGSQEETFAYNNLDAEANIWLDPGSVSLTDYGNANVSDTASIMRFLHNL